MDWQKTCAFWLPGTRGLSLDAAPKWSYQPLWPNNLEPPEDSMNVPNTRREFLADVGRGMLIATVGCGMARELCLAPAFAADAPDTLDFGPLEPLVRFMQETPANRLVAGLADK